MWTGVRRQRKLGIYFEFSNALCGESPLSYRVCARRVLKSPFSISLLVCIIRKVFHILMDISNLQYENYSTCTVEIIPAFCGLSVIGSFLSKYNNNNVLK